MTESSEDQCLGTGETEAIPLGMRRLASEVLHNVSELEAALLARRWPVHVWNAGNVSRRLKIGHAQAEGALSRLVTVGLLDEVGPGNYRYRPATEASRALDALSSLYHSHRQTVLRLLFSRAKGAVSYYPPPEKASSDRDRAAAAPRSGPGIVS